MKTLWKNCLSISAILVAGVASAQTLDDAPSSAQSSLKAPPALLVAVPENGEQKDQAIVIPFRAIEDLEILDVADIEKNREKIAGEIEDYLASEETKAKKTEKKTVDVATILKSKASKVFAEEVGDLKSRDAWFRCFYRPYSSARYYNPYYYGYSAFSNIYYYSWHRPVYWRSGFNYFYYTYRWGRSWW